MTIAHKLPKTQIRLLELQIGNHPTLLFFCTNKSRVKRSHKLSEVFISQNNRLSPKTHASISSHDSGSTPKLCEIISSVNLLALTPRAEMLSGLTEYCTE